MALWAQHGGCPGTLVLTHFLLLRPCRTSTVWPPICPRIPHPCSWTPSRISTSCCFWSPMRSCPCRYRPECVGRCAPGFGGPRVGVPCREMLPFLTGQSRAAEPGSGSSARLSIGDGVCTDTASSVSVPRTRTVAFVSVHRELGALRRGASAPRDAQSCLRASATASAHSHLFPPESASVYRRSAAGPECSAAEWAFLRCAVGEKRPGVTDSGCPRAVWGPLVQPGRSHFVPFFPA